MIATKILLADDHAFLCEMLQFRLEEAGMKVVAKVHDAAAAVAAARRLEPEVAVLDIDMPGLSVFDALLQMRSEQPGMRAILLSAHVNDHLVSRALAVEVRGYLRKTESLATIVEAVRRVAAGRVFFSADVRKRIVVHGARADCSQPRSRIATLTPREVEVLGYIARGLSKKEISGLLNRSVKTVDQHCTNLMTKLEIHDRVRLTRFAIREGIERP